MHQARAQPGSEPLPPVLPPPSKAGPAPPAPPLGVPPGPPVSTGTLRTPGRPPQEVPLMSIGQDEPAGMRVEVGPVTPSTGVADVLLGSIGLVVVVVVAALVLGAVLGGVLVLVKHRLGWGGPDRDAEQHITLAPRD